MARTGNRLRQLDMPARRDILELFTHGAGDVLDSWFETPALKAAFGFDAIVGNFATPYAPGSAYVLLHHVFGEVNGKRGAWGHVVGGMGAITQAMAEEASSRGVEISTECEVAKVCIDRRGARGVQLTDGRLVDARCVVSNVNPKLLYLRMLDGAVLDPDFVRRIRGYKCGSATFRMNVALAELPDFSCLPGKVAREHHQSGIIIGPSLAYFEQAYFDARSFGCSRAPVIEMLIPSTVDDTLAPRGKHVASLFCQHFNPELPEGLKWDEIKEAAADMVIDTVTRHAPNWRQCWDEACSRRWTSSASSVWSEVIFFTVRSRCRSCGARGRCSAMPTTAGRCRGCTCVARVRIRAAASLAFPGTMPRARSSGISSVAG
jgi:phytoene dehydrogenase-like protein